MWLPWYLSKMLFSCAVELEAELADAAGAVGVLLELKYLFRRRDMLER